MIARTIPGAALLVAHVAGGGTPGTTYSGVKRETEVRPPRVEGAAAVTVDGRLDEREWAGAAVLTGFSQYAPTDGVAAADSTQVLVWYTATAIHFGVRAFEAHAGAGGRPAVHATLADRDRIAADDNVQLLLGTFNDGRQATVLAVNPLGVQADGALVETGQLRSQSSFSAATVVREEPDLSPDFVYESKGRVTDWGYEVEIRVPFKSLRFQPAREQSWRLNVVRRVQHSGAEDSWAPARRSSASFLAQSGTLGGLTDLRRGRVLDLTPELTQRTTGAPAPGGGWRYDAARPELGGTVRWGVTNNLTLNGTVNPDFSQVEADAGQFSADPRVALSVQEKRPFFLDGSEQFAVPSSLIYTRRIVQPAAAAKLTGKLSGMDVALLSAVDDRAASRSGSEHPVYNVVRVQRDVGGRSRVGVAYTDRVEGGDYNRVADVDGRFLFGDIYSAQFQLAGSMTRRASQRGAARAAPLWEARFARNGRTLGVRYRLTGIDPDFEAQSGFVARPGIARANLVHSLTHNARAPEAALQSVTGDVTLDGTWQYDRFARRDDAQDKKLHLNGNATLRGGWRTGASLLLEKFGYDDALFADYWVERPRADGSGALDTVRFTGTPRLPNRDYVLSLTTPDFRRFSANGFVIWGRDDNFYEWAPADIVYATLAADWRPTGKVRVNATYQHQEYRRPSDGSAVDVRQIPRLKLEYQLTRALFVRLVGEYSAAATDSLRDDSRTGAPILLRDPATGRLARTSAERRNDLRADWLFSYQPSPGTVFFAGYTSTRTEPERMRLDRLRRESDGYFVKLSYLLRR
ncbi:MAG: DUF5916 domain-containing protein [Gemmatimonadaceae bacterium]